MHVAAVRGNRQGLRAISLWGPGLLLVPAALLLIPIYLVPVAGLLLTSLGTDQVTLSYYRDVVSDRVAWDVLWETFVLATQVTIVCAVMAYPLAYLTLRASTRWQKIILVLVALPLWMSVLVRAFAWMVLLGREGIVNDAMLFLGFTSEPLQILYGRFAVVIGLVHVLLPFAVLPLLAVMKRVDLKLMTAAESLGAKPWMSFLLIFFPLTLPGIASGSIIVFMHSIGYFVTPAILGGLKETTYVMLIEQQVNNLAAWERAAAMSVILLLLTLAIVLLFGRSLGIVGSGEGNGARMQAQVPYLVRWTTMKLASLACGTKLRRHRYADGVDARLRPRVAGAAMPVKIAGWAVIGFLLLPVLVVLPLSFSDSPFLEFPPSVYSLRWYETYFSRRDWIEPTIRSFEVAAITMVLATAVGSMAAIGIARARFRGANACLAVLLSPAMIPTLIIAVALYFQFARLQLIGSISGLVLAHFILALPIVTVIVLGALRRVDSRPERAAQSLGAGPVRAFMSTTFVLVRPSIVAASLFAFLASFDDVTAAIFLCGTAATTLPKKMWESIRLDIDPVLASVSALLIVLSLALMLFAELAKRRSRASGETVSVFPGEH